MPLTPLLPSALATAPLWKQGLSLIRLARSIEIHPFNEIIGTDTTICGDEVHATVPSWQQRLLSVGVARQTEMFALNEILGPSLLNVVVQCMLLWSSRSKALCSSD